MLERACDAVMPSTRKRSLVEMSACAVLVAALAVQPALGRDGKAKSKSGAAAALVTATAKSKAGTAAAAAPVTRTAKATAATPRPAHATSRAGSARHTTRQVAVPAAAAATTDLAATPAPTDTAPPVDPPPVVPANTPAPEDGAPVPTSPDPAPVETPTIAPPASGAVELPSRTPAVAGAVTVPPTPMPANALSAADREAVTSDAPIVTSAPAELAAEAQALAAPSLDTTAPDGTATPSASASGDFSLAPGAGSGSPQARGVTRRAPVTSRTTGGTAAGTALGEPLQNPATAAIARAGILAGTPQTSEPRPAGNVQALEAPQATIGSRIVDVVEVVPRGMWMAVGALGLLVLVLGANTLLAAARTRRLQRHREKLMEDIGLLQAALLPAIPSRMGALLTTVAYRPADGPAAGGDFYDAFALPDGRVGLLLGDVSGHGRQALAKTTLVRFTVRAHLEAGMSPREAISIAGRTLDGRLSDDFATVLAAIHDPATGTLTYSSAGHPPPLVLGPSAHAPVTASSAPPIGAGFPTGQRQTIVPMPEGTTVAVYSDGLLEARIDGEPLGSERLSAWLAELGPEASAKQLLDLVVQRADLVPDDLAAVVLHAAPGATAPASRVEQLKLDVLDVEGPDLDGFLRAAGVTRGDRAIAGRNVSEQLAITGGVIVEVRSGKHPTVSVYAIGERSAARASAPAR
jgi:hypothetical protein